MALEERGDDNINNTRELLPWRHAVLQSRCYEEYRVRCLEANENQQEGGSAAALAYQIDIDEIWARSYSQFIATHSKSSSLRREFHMMRECFSSDYWDDEDFEPIGRQIREVLRNHQWLS